MKTTLLSGLCILFFSTITCSQSNFRFADSTAQWNVLEFQYGWFPINPDRHTTYIFHAGKDTVINNTSYQLITHMWGQLPLRRDSANRIYRYQDDTTEYALYDFGKMTGDTIWNPTEPWLTNYIAIVDSVDSVNIGHWRKRMFVHPEGTNGNVGYAPDIWVDGIGAFQTHLLEPLVESIGVDMPDYTLLCYFENDSLQFHQDAYDAHDTCVYNSPTAIDEVQGDVSVRVYPSPANANDYIIVDREESTEVMFRLFDITGGMVLQKQLMEKNSQLQLGTIVPGIYSYAIDNSIARKGKLIIQ